MNYVNTVLAFQDAEHTISDSGALSSANRVTKSRTHLARTLASASAEPTSDVAISLFASENPATG